MTYPPQDPHQQPRHPQQLPAQYPPPAATPARKPPAITTGGWVAIGLGAVGVAVMLVVSVASTTSGLPDQSRNGARPYSPPIPTDTGPVSIPPFTPAATQAAPPKPTISEGTWTVGVDFPTGTYRTVGAGSSCYWKITKSGSNESDIVNNHIGGGNLTVALSSGQDFTTIRCGTWTKAG